VRATPNRYLRLRGSSHLFMLLNGYAVFDNASMPIVGPRRTANDTFVDQVRMNAKAALAALTNTGCIDPKKVAVAGHSYGAFMTANLLAHSDLFCCGIARSGAYNRTLTPFGFQNEERTYWEAPEIYFAMSPFMHVDKINEPILLIHGQDDNNSGTFPIQSQRLFVALKGHGATARLCFLPFESHGYRGRQSVLHCLAEMSSWLDQHCKRDDN
jgi:dipeptidyl aminopeptidase/acylaminoacyl peptidase